MPTGNGKRRARQEIERELQERATDEQRQRSGSTPTEDELERALEAEDDVEWHAGEDAGEVTERGDDDVEGAGPAPGRTESE